MSRKSNQSPMFISGSRHSFRIQSRPQHVGPQMLQEYWGSPVLIAD